MAIPNGGLITETNEQYYAGSQRFLCEDAYGTSVFVATFNTDLIFGSYDPSSTDYALNNFENFNHNPRSLIYNKDMYRIIINKF